MKPPNRCYGLLIQLVAILSFLLAEGIATCAAQTPEKIIVADVIVPPGNYHLSMARIYALIKTRPGSEYNPDTIDDDLRALFETHAFVSMQVKKTDPDADGKVTVYFMLTPLPNTVREIIYEGAGHFSNRDLEAATGLRKGMPLNPITNVAACRSIENRYEEKGYTSTKVDLLEGGKYSDTQVHFLITEGPKTKTPSTQFHVEIHEEVTYSPNGEPGEIIVHYDLQEHQPVPVGQIYILSRDLSGRPFMQGPVRNDVLPPD